MAEPKKLTEQDLDKIAELELLKKFTYVAERHKEAFKRTWTRDVINASLNMLSIHCAAALASLPEEDIKEKAAQTAVLVEAAILQEIKKSRESAE